MIKLYLVTNLPLKKGKIVEEIFFLLLEISFLLANEIGSEYKQ